MDGSTASDDGPPPCARFGGLVATELVEVAHDADALGTSGRWAVAITYEGLLTAARFNRWEPGPAHMVAGPWQGPATVDWASSMSQQVYQAAVESVRDRISRGDVYQANVCRILSAPLPDGSRADLGGLHALLTRANPAPFQGFLRLPGLQIASASPELFLRRERGVLSAGPIKGTGRTEADLLAKDVAENVMIVDLVRNDLARVCLPGTVKVSRLLARERHPGLVHLVSEVCGTLRGGTSWREILAAMLPPGSVSGAPKSSAVRIITALEPVPRGIYCGALGWIDAEAGTAVLAVGIRTFWSGDDALLRFGTGAGITWGSQTAAEWRETELKAAHLLTAAAGSWPVAGAGETGAID